MNDYLWIEFEGKAYTQSWNIMNNSSVAIALIFYLGNLSTAHAQTELGTIELDPSLEDVQEIRHFYDDQGNFLFNFMGNEFFQFSLLRGDTLASSKTLYLPDKHQFLDAIYDENHLSLFYRNKKEKDVYLYYTDMQTLPEYMVKAGTRQDKEISLADVYHQGDFLSINYSRKPFTFHTYCNQENQAFVKQEQVFDSGWNWQFFGRIQTQEEIIFVRLQQKNSILHFYRYFKGRGFEEISFSLRSLYKERGFSSNGNTGGGTDYIDYYTANKRWDAFIEGEDIYLDLSPGILHLNWTTKEPQLLSFDAPDDIPFVNRKFELLGNCYYKLLVNRSQLELSIYDIASQSLLKKYAYKANQNIDLIYGFAQKSKRLYSNLRLWRGASIPVSTRYGKTKKINTEELLNNLSAESLSFRVSNDGDAIKLEVSGTDYKGVWVEKSETASFVGFLNAADLEIIKEEEESIDPIFTVIDEYIAQLEEGTILGEYYTYYYQDKIHLAYIDKNLNCCKIIGF